VLVDARDKGGWERQVGGDGGEGGGGLGSRQGPRVAVGRQG
jgi:hypothetical protein